MTEQEIREKLDLMRERTAKDAEALSDVCILTDYSALADGGLWTKALQRALDEHEVVVIPPASEDYLLDDTVTVPSNRKIVAEGAVLRLVPECRVLMLRNVHTHDGSHAPIDGHDRDENISIWGGIWEETRHAHFPADQKSGMYDRENSLRGVQTCMLFNNIRGLTLSGVTFRHTAALAVQVGDITDAVFERIRFEDCYADGLHINGNTQNILVRDVKGQVGDDLVALNMYDWKDYSVNFGPGDTILCEDLAIDPKSRYFAMRLEPGVYPYDDGTKAQCSLSNVIISRVTGIRSFKLYYQTPRYELGTLPEPGEIGSADDIYFENITIDLTEPANPFKEYMDSDPVKGYFGAFELGSTIGNVSFRNIDLTLHKELFPLSRLAVCGPKSCRVGNYEIFDPYVSSTVKRMEFSDITVNGKKADTPDDLVHVVSFDDVNRDGRSSGAGSVDTVILNGKAVSL